MVSIINNIPIAKVIPWLTTLILSTSANSSELLSFSATSTHCTETNCVIQVRWTTAVEIETIGYNIWRSSLLEGGYIKINTQRIAAKGSPEAGAEYYYADSTPAVQTMFYKLEALGVYGRSTFHGPVKTSN